MFTATNISTGTKAACFDTFNDIDFYVYKPSSTGNHTLTASCSNNDDIDCDIYNYNGDLIAHDHYVGQVTISFSVVGNKNCFIKLYNSNQHPTDYNFTLS